MQDNGGEGYVRIGGGPDSGSGTHELWHGVFGTLCQELRANRGRPGLIDTADHRSSELVERLTSAVSEVVSIGTRVAQCERMPTAVDLMRGVAGASVLLVDIEVLFEPALHLEVVSQLRRTSQNTALIVAWPGQIAAGRLSYSLPGRADHIDEPVRDLVVLRPVETHFPDEVPYTVERYPA